MEGGQGEVQAGEEGGEDGGDGGVEGWGSMLIHFNNKNNNIFLYIFFFHILFRVLIHFNNKNIILK